MLEQNADKLRRSPFITKELWANCKGLATIKGQTIGKWVADAMAEKYVREIKQVKTEASNEK
jgi:hypothetical protein